ncbi:hypothetical protein BN997_01096 [Oceanobacillus oncorhynchi]|uniref:Uncharacterized protein n=1 Tax=Oceanobacillus oncorhynchi TaxID=545501 RepID=A0A0A1MDZ1_9BACI|nr:hypothetical protein [Oceanobacillus oncorhynchi]CEI81278.1 hypothetical protein BN997_01096 [Oceanobacillus oncorhynchi]
MKHYEAYDGTDLIAEGTAKAIKKKLGITTGEFQTGRRRAKKGYDEEFNVIEVDKPEEYAVYKGDEYLFIDTKENVMQRLGISQGTFTFYMSPANAKRDGGDKLIIVNLDKVVD